MTTESLDLVWPQEIAARLGVKPQTVAVWKMEGKMPAPEWVIANIPVWRWEVIAAWFETRTDAREGLHPQLGPRVPRKKLGPT